MRSNQPVVNAVADLSPIGSARNGQPRHSFVFARIRGLLVTTATLLVLALHCSLSLSQEIGYIEDFSLAKDRKIPLTQLIPGTEDYYYYHALDYQNREQFDKVEEILKPWIKRFNYTTRVHEIMNRQALLTYDKDPRKSLEYIRRRLSIHFNHQRETINKKDLPTRLDQNLISRDTLTQQALRSYQNTHGFEDAALDWLIATDLNATRRRHLLQRLQRPDYANLPKLVVNDLNYRSSSGFGSFAIHRQLTLAELEECLKLKPDLLNQTHFVNTYLTKLRPSDDVDWRNDVAERNAYYQRLWAFVSRLTPVHNSLKAHVLYQQLELDRAEGKYDKQRLMTYLRLPRNVSYIEPKFMEIAENRRWAANLHANYQPFTLLPIVGNDEPLVKSYLHHFFVDEQTYKPYEPYINDLYLKHNFAEAKIVNGLGDVEQWASMLPPAQYKALRDRIDLDFSYTNDERFGANEAVNLDLYVKNVEQLIVKVYRINTLNYYRDRGQEVDTSINLDGLVANQEATHVYKEPDVRRVRRHFDFPELKKPGVYVIDFIGNGKSSRVVVRKGKLRYVAKTTAAGQRFIVLDEQNQLVQNARLWIDGHTYPADKQGNILVPFSNRPGRQPIILSSGDFHSLDHFQQESEQYSLTAGIYVDRESLLTRKEAKVIVRPQLLLNGIPTALALLEKVKLVITSTDLDNVSTSKEVSDFPLTADKDATYEFQVPQRLASLRFVLIAEVKNVSQNKTQHLSTSEQFSLNQIDRTAEVEDLHLGKSGETYIVDLLGRSGESRVDRPVAFILKHKDFRNPVHVSLQTDEIGRISLGALKDIVSIQATSPSGRASNWTIRADRNSHYRSVQGKAEGEVFVPYAGTADKPLRSELSLLEMRGDTFVADRFDALKIEGGLIVVKNLPAGDYDLLLKRINRRIRIRLTAGVRKGDFVLGDYRLLEVRGEHPLQIADIESDKQQIRVALQNVDDHSRLHVFATRYYPAFDPYAYLGRVVDPEPYRMLVPKTMSHYLTGRNIGDEYRYIIDRKYAKKLPGNTLTRPSLLLNPWAIRSTETGQQLAQQGGQFGRNAPPSASRASRGPTETPSIAMQGDFSDLNFISNTSSLLLNLTPDKNGVVAIDREKLAAHQLIHLVAADRTGTVYRMLSLEETPSKFRDLRLLAALDANSHFIEQKQISLVEANDTLKLKDITTSKFEAYDTIPRVYALYATLSRDSKLLKFNFILNWHNLTPAEKGKKYSEFACHELNFFLYKKDKPFFEAVVQPYLRNKLHRTFLDEWLLGANLSDYLKPWNYEQLNTVEKILLSQRIAGEQTYTVRFVQEQVDLLPPNIDRYNKLFSTAIQGSALDTNDRFDLGAATKTAEMSKQLRSLAEMQKKSVAAGKPGNTSGAYPNAALFGNKNYAEKLARKEQAAQEMQRAATASDERNQKADAKSSYRRGRLENKDRAEAEMALADDLDQSGDYLREKRKSVRQYYRKLDKTKEWVENNYYELPIDQQIASLISSNAFWNDYARHQPDKDFYSTSFAEASRNFPEMMFALSVLDLPMESKDHKTEFADAEMTFKAGNTTIVLHQEIKQTKPAEQKTSILVSENFFRHNDRYRYVNGQKLDKFVAGEFLVHTVYGCQVVITNPTSSPQKLDVLTQIPKGAVPVMGGKYTDSRHIQLQPYNTTTLVYHFYFPATGQFPHYPVHVARHEQLIAFAAPTTLNVVRKLTNVDRQSWAYISQFGTDDQVVNYLQTNNLQRTNLEKIAFRMRDKSFFNKITRLLAERHTYNHTLWSYGIYHNHVPQIQQYLQHANSFVAQCGQYLDSRLLAIRPVVRKTYEHMSYKPLVNARAHQLGDRRQILNDRFRQQYHRLLKILSYQRSFDDDSLMEITYYLLLQDRVPEAMEFFTRVNPDRLHTKLQHEYFAAYFDFYSKDHKLARLIAEKNAKHPVDRWRKEFENMVVQLNEIDGQEFVASDDEDRTQLQTQLAATEPNFDFQVEAKTVNVNYQNLGEVQVNFYLMDVELLFSRNPFVKQFSGSFSYIRPNRTEIVKLPKDKAEHAFPIPADLHNSNVLVELVAAGQKRTQPYYSNSLAVQIIENYGQVRVSRKNDRQALSTVYVKVYAEMKTGGVKFYKDGYTDLRGRFDYSSLNTNEIENVSRFSILVLSEEHGAVVREARPPKQ